MSYSTTPPVSLMNDMILLPRTEEIGLQIITTVKISNKFSWQSPYISILDTKMAKRGKAGVVE